MLSKSKKPQQCGKTNLWVAVSPAGAYRIHSFMGFCPFAALIIGLLIQNTILINNYMCIKTCTKIISNADWTFACCWCTIYLLLFDLIYLALIILFIYEIKRLWLEHTEKYGEPIEIVSIL